MSDSKGNTYGPAIRHIAATPEPVIRSGNFEPVSLSRNGVQITASTYVPASPGEDGTMKTLIAYLGLAADATEEQVLAKMKERERAAAPASDVKALEARATTAEGKVVALEATVKTLEAERAARVQAECDAAVGEVKALAAKAGKPEVFDADREKRVRARWTTDNEGAREILALARSAVGAPSAAGGAPVKSPEAANVEAAAKSKAANDLDSKIALARGAGCTIKVEGKTVLAVRADGEKVKLGDRE